MLCKEDHQGHGSADHLPSADVVTSIHINIDSATYKAMTIQTNGE